MVSIGENKDQNVIVPAKVIVGKYLFNVDEMQGYLGPIAIIAGDAQGGANNANVQAVDFAAGNNSEDDPDTMSISGDTDSESE